MTVLNNFGAIDITDEGAVLDGVTDDLAAWNRAVAKAAPERRPIFVPPGTSRVSGPVDLQLCDVHGVGVRSSLVLFDDGGFFSSVNSNEGFGVSDLFVRGSSIAGQVLIDFTGQNYPRVDNVVLDLADVGMRLARVDGGVECHYGGFTNMHVQRCNRGVELLQVGVSSGANAHSFYGGRFWAMNSPGGVGIWIDDDVNNINLYGVYFEVGTDNWAIDSGCDFFAAHGVRNESGLGFRIRAGAGIHTFTGGRGVIGIGLFSDENTPPVHRIIDEATEPYERLHASAGVATIRSDRLWASYNRSDLQGVGGGTTRPAPDMVFDGGDMTLLCALQVNSTGFPCFYTDRENTVATNQGILAHYQGLATHARFSVFVSDGVSQMSSTTTGNVSTAAPSDEIKVGGFRVNGGTLESFMWRPIQQDAIFGIAADISTMGQISNGTVPIVGAETDLQNSVNVGDLYSMVLLDEALSDEELSDVCMFMHRDLGRFTGTFRDRPGSTADRPTRPFLGQLWFDTTLGRPVWWDGTSWVDSTGTAS